ncbi:MAG TPA: aldo/keto reductase [Ktedonobacteraceae bacterium]|nr:aldo/keto reductase [Ktedonobacteraceae bacterium]
MKVTDQRPIGSSKLVVPALGVGLISWGERLQGYGKTHTFEDLLPTYRACLDAGLTFFDTAEFYGRGESERLLGECRKADGRPVQIASKFAPLPGRRSAADLRKALDGSLRRLGVERLDLYQIHLPVPGRLLHELIDELAEAVRVGKVLAVGVSNFRAPLMRRAHARLAHYGIPLASNQVHYNLLYRHPEQNGVLDACRELGVALIPHSPLEQGILTGKFRGVSRSRGLFLDLTGASMRRLDPFGDTKGSISAGQRLLKGSYTLPPERWEALFVVLEEIARAHEKTIAQVSLNWLLSKDECIIPIPGAKNVRQASENAAALGWRLTREEHERISQAAHTPLALENRQAK